MQKGELEPKYIIWDILIEKDDFNKNESPKIEAGRRQMLKGNLKPFFTIHDIIVPKKDINELWK